MTVYPICHPGHRVLCPPAYRGASGAVFGGDMVISISDHGKGSRFRGLGRSLLLGLMLALLMGGSFAAYVMSMPPLKPDELAVLTRFPPKQLADLVAQRDVLLKYSGDNPTEVLVGLSCLYVLMQTFAVPGTLSLSVLAGGLFGFRAGLALVTAVSTAGACSCYALSSLCGRAAVQALWPARLEQFSAGVTARRAHLLNYLVFLRVTPLLPNTFINVASPIVGVPLWVFIAGTALGCLPNHLIAVSAGCRLGELESLSDLYDRRLLLAGCAAGLLALAPIWLKRRYERSGGGGAGGGKAGRGGALKVALD